MSTEAGGLQQATVISIQAFFERGLDVATAVCPNPSEALHLCRAVFDNIGFARGIVTPAGLVQARQGPIQSDAGDMSIWGLLKKLGTCILINCGFKVASEPRVNVAREPREMEENGNLGKRIPQSRPSLLAGSHLSDFSPLPNHRGGNCYPTPPLSTHRQGLAPATMLAGNQGNFSKFTQKKTKSRKTTTSYPANEENVPTQDGIKHIREVVEEEDIEMYEGPAPLNQQADVQAESNFVSRSRLI